MVTISDEARAILLVQAQNSSSPYSTKTCHQIYIELIDEFKRAKQEEAERGKT